jgi:hypothetical protein
MTRHEIQVLRAVGMNRTLPSGEIVRRLREEHGYVGGKSAVYEVVHRLRAVPPAPLVRCEGWPRSLASTTSGRSTWATPAGGRSASGSSPAS